MIKLKLLSLCLSILFLSCISCFYSQQENQNDYIYLNNQLLDVVMKDQFSPPQASRVYMYPNLAAYYSLQMCFPDSLDKIKLKGFDYYLDKASLKKVDKHALSDLVFIKVAKKLVFSEHYFDSLECVYIKKLSRSNRNETVFWATNFAETFINWVNSDNYSLTRTQKRFTSSNEVGKWRETPPDYQQALEPNWNKIKPIMIGNPSQFFSNSIPVYSTDTSSAFYKMAYEVYAKQLTDQERETALFWDDNPNISEHRGHLIMMKHKISPPGHWMSITGQVCENQSTFTCIKAYALVSIAMYDGIIACWSTKFVVNLIRPITYIHEHIDANWSSFIQTPPFPEYPSGHSVLSAAAAEILSQLFGTNYAFADETNVPFGFSARSFKSFHDAAWEVSMSRFYGGIHYMNSVVDGNEQGTKIGKYVWDKYLE